MNDEPRLQQKKKIDGLAITKTRGMEPSLQRKKRPQSSSPVRQAMEPEFQRKKKPIPYKKTAPIATEISQAGNQQDEYMLLGDQSKFNNNVKYRLRSQSANEHSGEKIPTKSAEKVTHSDTVHHSPSNKLKRSCQPVGSPPRKVQEHMRERQSRTKERGPPPKVIIDTGKPTKVVMKSQEELKQHHHEQEARVWNNDHFHHKGILRKSVATQSTPHVVGEIQSSVAGVPFHQAEKDRKFTKDAKSNKNTNSSSSNARETHPEDDRKREKFENKEVRLDEKALASKAADHHERGPNHAIKYRLGIAPHLSTAPIRFSEYQREFQWKDPTKASPLISANSMVNKSHPDLTLFRSAGMAEDSEYRAQFKDWKPPQEQNRKQTENDERLASSSSYSLLETKKPKIQRSKSMKELLTRPKPIASLSALNAPTNLKQTKPHEENDSKPESSTKKKKVPTATLR